MSIDEFILETKKLGINVTKEMLEKFETYADFLLEYNTHTNLTAIKTKEEVYLKHFYDSLTITKLTTFEKEKILDIGTGAGFPGLPLAICFPNLNVTLLDSNNKKITFLKECIQKLNLKNVEIIYERAEDYGRKNREQFDYVTSRAVADLRILLELSIPVLKVKGSFLGMKGNMEEELDNARTALEVLNSKIVKREDFNLPIEKSKRTLLKIEKQKETNSLYPRVYDKIKKKPL